MKNILTIVLSLVLAAAIIFGLVLYGKYADTKDALLISKEKLSELNEKIIQLDQETSALNDQIEKNTERFKELENAKKNIEELENMISVKDQGLSEFEEKILNLESDFEEVRKANEALFTELSSRNAEAMELKEKLEGSQSRIIFLEDVINKSKNEIEGFQDQLSELRGDHALALTKIDQLKSSYDANIMELKSANERISKLENTVNMKDQGLLSFKERLRDVGKQFEEEKKAKAALETELSYRDATTTELEEKLKSSQSRILYLEGEIAKGKGEIEEIQRQLSDLETEKAVAVSKINQLKSSYDANSMELKSSKRRISELENTIRVKNQRLSSFDKELNNLEKQLEEEKKAKAALETELAYRDATTRKLQEKLEGSQSRIIFLENVINKSKNEIEELQRQLSELRGDHALALTKIDQLKSSYDANSVELEEEKKAKAALETEMAYRDATTTELKEKLESSQSRIIYLEGEIAKHKGEIEEIQLQLSDLETEKAIAVSKLNQLKSSYDVNSMELKNANERISELENTISVKNQRLSSFEEELNNLEKQLEEEKKAMAALETERSYRDAATKEIQEKLKSSQSWILSLEDEIAKGKSETERLQLRLSNIKGEKDIAETKIGQLKTTYENLVSDLKKQIENQEVTIKTFEEKISVTFVDRILFEFGKAKISPKGRMILGKIGNTLKNVQGKQIRVVGHTDDVPISPGYHYKFPSNWELSAARAASVVNYLQNEQGLDPANLEAVGRSFYKPIASNETSKGRAQNRRVNINIVPKAD